jgi:hypothetical protein
VSRSERSGLKPPRGGRKLGIKNKRSPLPLAERSVSTIEEFCAAHRISRARYFELKKQGLTPTEMAVGKLRLISHEAAAAWRRKFEGSDTAA